MLCPFLVVLAGQRSRRQRPSWRRGQLSKLSRQAGGLQDVGKFLQQEDAPQVRMGKSKINRVLAFGPPWSYCAAGCAEEIIVALIRSTDFPGWADLTLGKLSVRSSGLQIAPQLKKLALEKLRLEKLKV